MFYYDLIIVCHINFLATSVSLATSVIKLMRQIVNGLN